MSELICNKSYHISLSSFDALAHKRMLKKRHLLKFIYTAQALIYDKALRLSSWSISEEEKPSDKDKEQHCHQQTADIGTLMNLMAEDAYNVMSFFWIGHYIWAIPLKVCMQKHLNK